MKNKRNGMHALETIHMEALKAAREGNIDKLYCLIEKNPQVLHDFDNFKFVDSPLHEAARSGQTHFAIEVMNLQPSLGKKLNPQGLSALDLAVLEDETIIGEDEEIESTDEKRQRKNETAKALIGLDAELIRVKGKKMMTPMHHAVMENNEDLLAEFLCACPGSIDDRTNRFQNAVHLSVENKKLEIFYLLLGWLKRRNRKDVLSFQDEDGNNSLHVAVQKGEVQIVKKLVHEIHRTCRNKKKLTALDIADQNQNTTIKHLLMNHGVLEPNYYKLASDAETLSVFMKSPEFVLEIIRKYFYARGKMSPDLCNIFLVVAALIISAALQGILSPPGGVWQGNGDTPANLKAPASALDMYKYQRKHLVGKAVTRPDIFNDFVVANSMAFTLACMLLFSLIPYHDYSITLFASLFFFTWSYLKAMVMVSEPSSDTSCILIITGILAYGSFVSRVVIFVFMSLSEDYWWMQTSAINLIFEFRIMNKLGNSLLRMRDRLRLQEKVCSFQRP